MTEQEIVDWCKHVADRTVEFNWTPQTEQILRRYGYDRDDMHAAVWSGLWRVFTSRPDLDEEYRRRGCWKYARLLFRSLFQDKAQTRLKKRRQQWILTSEFAGEDDVQPVEAVEAATPDEVVSEVEEKEQLRVHIEETFKRFRVPREHRQAFLMWSRDKLTIREIAARFQVTYQRVQQWLDWLRNVLTGKVEPPKAGKPACWENRLRSRKNDVERLIKLGASAKRVRAFRLHYCDGLKFSEIAALEGVGCKVAKWRCEDARRILDGTCVVLRTPIEPRTEEERRRRLLALERTKLCEARKEAIRLQYVDGLSLREIALRQQAPYKTVADRLYDGRKKFLSALEELEKEGTLV